MRYQCLSPLELRNRLIKPDINICPYNYAKYIANKVNVILAPYNYLLNPEIRKSVNLDLKDAIIVFDEAHNITNSAEQALSMKINE